MTEWLLKEFGHDEVDKDAEAGMDGLTKETSKIIYDLHTLPAKSTILAGLDVDESEIQYENDFNASYVDFLVGQISNNITYWHTLE